MPPFLAGGAYTTATYVFPDRFSTSELSNAYVVTGTVRYHLAFPGVNNTHCTAAVLGPVQFLLLPIFLGWRIPTRTCD